MTRQLILAIFFLCAPARGEEFKQRVIDADLICAFGMELVDVEQKQYLTCRKPEREIEKTPLCSGVAPVALVQRETIYHPVYVSKKKVFGLVSIFYALEMLKPCEMPGRIRSRKDAKCYKPGREP